MKKSIIGFLLIFGASQMVLGQSKISYTLQFNQSESVDDVTNICIFYVHGGRCFDLKANWKTYVSGLIDIELNPRFSFQTGMGYQVLSQDLMNREFETDRYKYRFLSLPLRGKYYLNRAKVRFYAGAGFRLDVKLNNAIPLIAEHNVYDNLRSMAISAESLIGIQIPVTSKLQLSFEPTYSFALTSYADELDDIFTTLPASLSSFAPSSGPFLGLPAEKPKRIGISMGINFKF